MHITNCRCQEVHTGSDELFNFFGGGKYTFHVRSIGYTVLSAFDPTGLSFSRNASRVAVRHELLSLGQVLGLLVVRHIHHDRVERQRVCGQLDEYLILAMVKVDCYRYGRFGSCIGSRPDEKAIAELDLPWEDLNDEGAALALCCFDNPKDVLNVVAVADSV